MLGERAFNEDLNYFDFIVAAELALYIPLYLIEAPMRNLKEQIDSKVFNTLITLKWSTLSILISSCYNDFLRVIWRLVLSLGVLTFFFETSLNIKHIKAAVILMILNIPFALAVGMFLCALYLYFGRGQFLVGQINVFLSVLSGAFFPITVFPKILNEFVSQYIPFANYLTSLRNADLSNLSYQSAIFWIVILFFIFKFFKKSLGVYSQRGFSIYRF